MKNTPDSETVNSNRLEITKVIFTEIDNKSNYLNYKHHNKK